MKFFTFPAFAGVCFAINPFDPLICFDASPDRISATIPKSTTQSATSSANGWATTSSGLITSYDYNDKSSTVWVFPTGSGSHDATKVIFEGVQVINISFVVIVVEIIGSQTTTVVSPSSSSTSISSTSKLASIASSDITAVTQPSTTHLVYVRTDEEYAFNPSQLNASVGDTVHFTFLGRNLSVIQSDLESPCTYNGGFDTGFYQVNSLNISGKFIIDFHINVSMPLWFHCKQLGSSHCGKGKVFAINPEYNFNKFQKIAKAQGEALTILTRVLGAIGNVSSISMNAIDNKLPTSLPT